MNFHPCETDLIVFRRPCNLFFRRLYFKLAFVTSHLGSRSLLEAKFLLSMGGQIKGHEAGEWQAQLQYAPVRSKNFRIVRGAKERTIHQKMISKTRPDGSSAIFPRSALGERADKETTSGPPSNRKRRFHVELRGGAWPHLPVLPYLIWLHLLLAEFLQRV
jgi:hypothetical protein